MPSDLRSEAAVYAAAAAIDGREVDPACDPAFVVERAILHRVSALVLRSGWGQSLPRTQTARLEEDARLGALHAALLDREVQHLASRLIDSGVTPLVIKGAHLAHRVYPTPAFRPRADTDLLIDPATKTRAAEVLAACGYSPSARTSGSVILGQFAFERRLRTGVTHYVDVHWRPAAPLILERAFDVGGIAAAAAPIPALGPHACGPAIHDALALACVHLVAHHWDEILLIWLEDIRLLAEALDENATRHLIDRAIAGSYTVVLHAALSTARQYFDGAGLDRAIAAVAPRVIDTEASSALVRHGRRKIDDLWLDLRCSGWPERARLLREHVLPPADYMRARFRGPVPLAYAMRVLLGVRKWF